MLYILIAANNKGLLWINEFLSQHFQEDKSFSVLALEEPFFTDTWDGFVIYPLGGKEPGQLFVNEKIGVLPSEVNKLFSIDLKTTADKWIIRQPITFQNKTYFNVHRLLRAIDKNVLLSKLCKADECSQDEYFVPPDIIHYAQSRGFYHVGRGSGANSIVAYCLQITDVNPIELDLCFERFLNPRRTSPPDFDIDFSWLDRDEVIDYVFKRYGKKQVALLAENRRCDPSS